MEVDTETVKTDRLVKNARLEARVTIEQKQLLERAASLRGQNLGYYTDNCRANTPIC